MALHYVTVEIGGSPDLAMDLIRSLPGGEHDPQTIGDDRYLVATTNAGFLTWAIEHQGYGRVVSSELIVP